MTLGPDPTYFASNAERLRAFRALERACLFLDRDEDRDAVMDRFERLYPPRPRKSRKAAT